MLNFWCLFGRHFYRDEDLEMKHTLKAAVYINHCYYCGKERKVILPLSYVSRWEEDKK